MRINRYLAAATGISRRAGDRLVEQGKVSINGVTAKMGQNVENSDNILLGTNRISLSSTKQLLILNKPVGYVVSREGQGSLTAYTLLPKQYHKLKPIGRLDKQSSGLLLFTNDGILAQRMTHPKNEKDKEYDITLLAPLKSEDYTLITSTGVMLDDGLSKFNLREFPNSTRKRWIVTMHEGRNRQIRRTFSSLGYHVHRLHRTRQGEYSLDDIPSGSFKIIEL